MSIYIRAIWPRIPDIYIWIFRARDVLRRPGGRPATSALTSLRCVCEPANRPRNQDRLSSFVSSSIVINKNNANIFKRWLKRKHRTKMELKKKMCILLTFGWVSSSGRKNVSLIFNYHIWQTLNRKFWKNGLLLLFLFHIFSLIIHIFKKYFDNFFGRGFDDFFVLAIHCGNAEIINMTFYCSRYSSRYS